MPRRKGRVLMLRMILHGASGRMGAALIAAAPENSIEVVAGISLPPAPALPCPWYASLEECGVAGDVIVDFSNPSALTGLLGYAVRTQTPLVLATTGFSPDQLEQIVAASAKIAIFRAANMSIGVNVLSELAQLAATALPSFDIEIIEKHHSAKVDAPSGTALMLADAINDVFSEPRQYVYERHSVRQPRQPREIGLHAVRGGTITGEHDVLFAGTDEIVTLSHTAYSRRMFAMGALRAARFVADKPPMLYGMREMIQEQSNFARLGVQKEQTLITLGGLPVIGGVSVALAALGDIHLDMISQAAPSGGTVQLSFSLSTRDAESALAHLRAAGIGPVSTEPAVKLSVEGLDMAYRSGVAAKVFSPLAEAEIEVRLITTSENKIAMCVPKEQAEAACAALQRALGIRA